MKKRMWLCVALCALLVWTSVPSLAEDCFTIDVDALDMNSLNSDEYVAQYLSASARACGSENTSVIPANWRPRCGSH